MEKLIIPRKKCDIDSHEIVMPQIDGSLVEIDKKFHVIYADLWFAGKTCNGFRKSSSHGISMAFAKKIMGFGLNFVQAAVKKTGKNPFHIFKG